MKKAIVCVLLALAAVILLEQGNLAAITGRLSALSDRGETQPRRGEVPAFSQQLGSMKSSDLMDVTLYYRFADTVYLGAQRAQLDIRREETVATSLVQRLIDGPDIAHDLLSGLFPQGTRLISVTGEGTTAFVTLSSEFLGRPEGAPASWEDSSAWQEEAALRRRLAVQSIALTLTEDARYQRIQLYIADDDEGIPQRIPLAWLDTGTDDPAVVLAACPRDEAAMLTPQHALDMIMDAWQAQNWAAMYPLMADTQDEPMPTLSVFETEMAQLGVTLLSYGTAPGTVSFDGQTATIVLDASIRSREGGDAEIIRESVRLVRVKDNWSMEPETIRRLMIRD